MRKIGQKKIREITFQKYNGRCAYCGSTLKKSFQIDHIVPIRRGCQPWESVYKGKGSDEMENYNPSCASCNSSKSVFSIEQWRTEIEKKYDRLIRDSATFRILIRFGIVKRAKKKVKFYFENL